MKTKSKTKPKPQSSEKTAQEAFLCAQQHRRRTIRLLRLALLLAFLLLWEGGVRAGKIDSFFFSSPCGIAACLLSMLRDGSLLYHLSVTLWETVVSFFLVLFLGILCASLLWYSRSASQVLEPYLVVLNSLPKSALAPLFLVWLGSGSQTIITAGVSVALFGCIISLYTGFCQVDEDTVRLIYTLGGTRLDVYRKVILPGSIPTILSAMKVNVGLALVGVIIGEFLAARRGLGYLIIYGSQVFQLHRVIASILVLCLIAMLLYQLIQQAERWYHRRL